MMKLKHSLLLVVLPSMILQACGNKAEGPSQTNPSVSWEIREDLVGDWRCIRNTFAADHYCARVDRFQIYRPYCDLHDIGRTDGPLEIAGVMMMTETNGTMKWIDLTNRLRIYLPDKLFVGAIGGGINFTFKRFKTDDGKEKLLLTRTKDASVKLEFELMRRECPLPKDADLLVHIFLGGETNVKILDAKYKALKEEIMRRLCREKQLNRR